MNVLLRPMTIGTAIAAGCATSGAFTTIGSVSAIVSNPSRPAILAAAWMSSTAGSAGRTTRAATESARPSPLVSRTAPAATL